MTFKTLEITEQGPAIAGTTRLGREVSVTLLGEGADRKFNVAVAALGGYEEFDIDGSAAEAELRWVMEETAAIEARLRERFGDDLSEIEDQELLRGAASLLDRRDVEPELIETLMELAQTERLRMQAPAL